MSDSDDNLVFATQTAIRRMFRGQPIETAIIALAVCASIVLVDPIMHHREEGTINDREFRQQAKALSDTLKDAIAFYAKLRMEFLQNN